MQLPSTFDARSKALMERVCYDAWWELKACKLNLSVAAESELRGVMALRVMEAVAQGQHDPAKLMTVALACGAERSGPDINRPDSPARGDAERPWSRGRHAGADRRVGLSAVSRS